MVPALLRATPSQTVKAQSFLVLLAPTAFSAVVSSHLLEPLPHLCGWLILHRWYTMGVAGRSQPLPAYGQLPGTEGDLWRTTFLVLDGLEDGIRL